MSDWTIICRFKDGSTYRQRGLCSHSGEFLGIEERIFNPDGTLRPLPDGRTSPADKDTP